LWQIRWAGNAVEAEKGFPGIIENDAAVVEED
jgi:hypothetical protein